MLTDFSAVTTRAEIARRGWGELSLHTLTDDDLARHPSRAFLLLPIIQDAPQCDGWPDLRRLSHPVAVNHFRFCRVLWGVS